MSTDIITILSPFLTSCGKFHVYQWHCTVKIIPMAVGGHRLALSSHKVECLGVIFTKGPVIFLTKTLW